MSNTTYKILWLEDQPEALDSLRILAEVKNIELDIALTGEEALVKLRNPLQYHGAILDVRGHHTPARGEGNRVPFSRVSDLLKRLAETPEVIPWVILTGQPDYKSSREFAEEFSDVPIFDKSNADDLNNLLDYLVQEGSDLERVRILNAFPDIMALGTTGFKTDKTADITKLCKAALLPTSSEPELLNCARTIFEAMVKKIADIKFPNQANLHTFSQIELIIGENKEDSTKEVMKRIGTPEYIKHSLKLLSYMLNAASHDDSEKFNSAKLREHIVEERNPYIVPTSISALFTVLQWYAKTQQHATPMVRSAQIQPCDIREVIESYTTKDSSNTYKYIVFVGKKYLLPKHESANFEVGNNVLITQYENTSNPVLVKNYPYTIVSITKQ